MFTLINSIPIVFLLQWCLTVRKTSLSRRRNQQSRSSKASTAVKEHLSSTQFSSDTHGRCLRQPKLRKLRLSNMESFLIIFRSLMKRSQSVRMSSTTSIRIHRIDSPSWKVYSVPIRRACWLSCSSESQSRWLTLAILSLSRARLPGLRAEKNQLFKKLFKLWPLLLSFRSFKCWSTGTGSTGASTWLR